MEYIPLHALAKELGVRPNDVMRMAGDVGITVVRVASNLSPKQAERIWAYGTAEAKRREKGKAAAVAAAAAPRSQVTARALGQVAPQVQAAQARRDGPEHACACCGLRVPHRTTGGEEEPVRCGLCSTHFEVVGEDEVRLLARLRDHDGRLRRAYQSAWTAATDFEERMKAALHSRDSWRGALVEVALAHEEAGAGRCKCGAKAFPCFTLRALESANRGIARQVERFGVMSDEDRERELYRRDHWDHDVA